jgi:chemotaxis protein MotB
MKYVFIQASLLMGMFLSISCVSSKKLDSANAQIQTLNSQVDGLNKQVADNQKLIGELKEENVKYSKEAQDCRIAKEMIAKNLQDMNKALAEQGTSFKKMKQKAQASLEKFEDAGAHVTMKNGLVHIELSNDLLFTSGSTTVGKEGQDALAVLGEVLNEYPKVKAYVIGHTDDAPVKSGYKDNWSLSTERANAIVRILRDKYNVDPSRLIAAGQGKYNPIADNDTEEGKFLNRRIVIIINPEISRIWETSVKK